MRLKKTLLCSAAALALATGTAFAGDLSQSSAPLVSEPMASESVSSSYERSDPGEFSYSELEGLERFDAIEPGSEQISEADVIWVYPVETIVLVPSFDTENPADGS